MYSDTIQKCSANAKRIVDLANTDKMAFWLSSGMAGAYVGLGIILIFSLGRTLIDSPFRSLVMGGSIFQS